MKHLIYAFILLSTPAWAESVTVVGVAADDRLNLRTGPAVSFPRQGSLAPGEGGIDKGLCVFHAPRRFFAVIHAPARH